MENVISHFEKHGKVFRDQLITVGDLKEFKDLLLSELKSILKDQVNGKSKKWLKAHTNHVKFHFLFLLVGGVSLFGHGTH